MDNPRSVSYTHLDVYKRQVDARYGRVLYLQDYASYIKDSFVSELCDLDRDLMLSIDILPVPTDEAARQLQSTLLGVETNVANWQRRQNANNNFTATKMCIRDSPNGAVCVRYQPTNLPHCVHQV